MSAAYLHNELRVCQRELAFSETELEAARKRAKEADEQHRREVSDLRNQVRDLSERVSTAYHRGSEEGIQTQRELNEAQSELGELCSEVMLAQAETEFAEAVNATSVREHREARELRSSALRAERACQELVEERQMLDSALPSLTDEIRRSDKAHSIDLLETEALEEAHKRCEHDVSRYEQDFRELHGNLKHVLDTLRATYIGSQREKMKLEERVASLERAQSPGVAAERKMPRQMQMRHERQHRSEWEQPDQPIEVVEQPVTRPAHRKPLPPRHVVREAARKEREARADEEAQRLYEQQVYYKKKHRNVFASEVGDFDSKVASESPGRSFAQRQRSPTSDALVDPLTRSSTQQRRRSPFSDPDEFRTLMDSAMSVPASPSLMDGSGRRTIFAEVKDDSDTGSNTSGYWQDPAQYHSDSTLEREMRRLSGSSLRGLMPK